MEKIVLEIASGLGLGGAEKILKHRLEVSHPGFSIYCCNTIPKLSKVIVNAKDLVPIRHPRIINLFRYIRNLSPDVVIVRSPRDCLRLSIIRLLFDLKFLAIYEAHSTFVSPTKLINIVLKPVLKIALRNFDQIISVSIDVQKGDQVCSNPKSTVRYMGSKISDGPTLRDSYLGKKFLFLGRMAKSKRPLWLIYRVRSLQKEFRSTSSKLLFVGDGKLLVKAKQLTKKLALDDIISFTGAINDPSFYLRESDWLISVSRNEGLPLVFFEAKLAGVSILSTPSGGGIEIFDSSDVLLKSFSPDEFEEMLKKLLEDTRTPKNATQIFNVKKFDAHELSKGFYEDIMK